MTKGVESVAMIMIHVLLTHEPISSSKTKIPNFTFSWSVKHWDIFVINFTKQWTETNMTLLHHFNHSNQGNHQQQKFTFFFNDWIITLYQCFIEIPSFVLFQCLKCPLEKQTKQISTMGLSWEVKNRKRINKLPHIRHKFHYGQKTQTWEKKGVAVTLMKH